MQNIKHTTEVFSGIYTVSLQRQPIRLYDVFYNKLSNVLFHFRFHFYSTSFA